MRALILSLALLVAACAGRPLTDAEAEFAAATLGPTLDTTEVTLVRGAVVGPLRATYPPRPRNTCRARIFPPQVGPQEVRFPAFAVGTSVYLARDFWSEDYVAGDALRLPDAMLLAHELTHVWQWQNRRRTGYHPVRAAFEHTQADDPYLADFDPDRPFADYTFEQQGALVEEFVCCRALDPDAARTRDLARVMSTPFGAIGTDPPARVALPWDGAQTADICS